jgi:hypothetical protein
MGNTRLIVWLSGFARKTQSSDHYRDGSGVNMAQRRAISDKDNQNDVDLCNIPRKIMSKKFEISRRRLR